MVHIVLFLHSNNTATLPSNITGNLSYSTSELDPVYFTDDSDTGGQPWRVFKASWPLWNQVTSTMTQSPIAHFVEQLLPAALDPYPWYTDVFIHTRKRTLIWSLSIYISNKYIYFIYAYILKYAAHIAKQRKQTEFWARDEARIIWKKYFSLILSPLGRR